MTCTSCMTRMSPEQYHQTLMSELISLESDEARLRDERERAHDTIRHVDRQLNRLDDRRQEIKDTVQELRDMFHVNPPAPPAEKGELL